MGQDSFLAMMPYISADLVAMIVSMQSISEESAVKKLYCSQLYAALEQEETKVWQYSTPMLYQMYRKSIETGEIQYPDI